jgi:hypothetical protein
MKFFHRLGLAGSIIQELRDGPIRMTKLKARLRTRGLTFTEPGIYKALRGLRSDDTVFLQKGSVTLNLRWLQELESFVSLAQHSHVDPRHKTGNFLQLADGDRIIYSFRNPVQVDTFWNHVLYSLFEAIPKLDRWYAYSSHHWFLLCRRSEEIALMTFMKQRGIRYLFTSGNRSALDASVVKDFDGITAQYNMLDTPLFPKRRNARGIVLNVVGDYVIEAQYDKLTTERIESFYSTHSKIEPAAIAALEDVVTKKAKIRFVIMKNSMKAQRLSRSFEKYFYFGKALQKKRTP